jgi:hypothetical protein
VAHTHPLLESLFPRHRSSVSDQVASLSHEVAHLARHAGRYATPRIREAAHSAGDLAGDVIHQLEPLARDVAHRAKVAGRAVRQDPVPAVIALGTFALIASLLLSGGPSRGRN